jgi:hypothetical protein
MATWTFKNPANNYTEEVNSTVAFLGALLLGPIYFAARGIWSVALFLFALNVISFLVLPFFLIAIPMHLGMAIGAASMIKSKYLRQGWINITALTDTPQSSLTNVQRRYKELEGMAKNGQLNAKEFKEARERLVAETGHPLNDSKPQTAPQTPAAPQDLVSRLSELDSLRKSGVLTDEEFSAAKAKLIAS